MHALLNNSVLQRGSENCSGFSIYILFFDLLKVVTDQLHRSVPGCYLPYTCNGIFVNSFYIQDCPIHIHNDPLVIKI